MRKFHVAWGVLPLVLAGCASLAPERHHAKQLVGRPIDEAVKVFGPPTASGPDMTQWKHGGKTIYYFSRQTGKSLKRESVGSVDSYDGYGASYSEIYRHVVTPDFCIVTMWVNDQKIIDYYEVHGTCGSRWYRGTTGPYHRYGIN